MKICALLLAKATSTLNDKNILPILDKPTMSYPMLAAKNTGLISSFYISSDSQKYLDIAKEFGYNGILRPDYLATDNSSAGIGGFINGGYAFAVGGASSSSTFTGDVGGFIHGPVANVGMRFSSKRDLAVGLSYMPSTRKEIDGMAVRLNITYHF